MARTVCYFTAFPQARTEAHARLAALLPRQAPARDWHLANAPGTAGSEVPESLARAAAVAAGAGRGLEAAGLWQRAADVSPGSRQAALRYGRAAAEADRCGDLSWSRQLWDRVTTLTDDPAVLGDALAGIGNQLMWQPAAPTVALAERLLTAGLDDPRLVRAVLAVAARAVFTDGDPAAVRRLRTLIEQAAVRTDPIADVPDADPRGDVSDAHLALAMAVADPAGWTSRYGPLRRSPLLRPLTGPAERIRLLSIAGVAWVLDDTEIAADHYRRSLDAIRADGSAGVYATATVMMAEVLFDLGLFEEAAGLLDDAEVVAGRDLAGPVRQAILAQRASSLIRRGEAGRAGRLLAAAGDPAAPAGRLARYLLLRASAQLAASQGDPVTAYERLRKIFDGGRALHHVLSPRSVVELAGVAIDAGRRDETVSLLLTAEEAAGRRTPRRQWSWSAAIGLLRADAGEPGAEETLRDLLAEPGAQRPYEYAVVEFRLAEALSAQRRRTEARPLLISALDAFTRVGAASDAAIVREKLRATGVRAAGSGLTAFDELTPQHQLIARLAAQGLSNRAIAERFGLAPRTIGSYLYQIYPKLGIARRGQLRDVVRL
ncbi:hypothetical protein ACTI_49490 [Actinoplanes sp. OR16]|uniref:LuxR family transcriptional regulator n=1 Tax=Actinoplanes sp. OR16 TaxID=946334 RepID=UPI000F6BDC8C|nr:LuxR family transcriptional regulator [Actinoplanes sp. OR16]BBH68264.1 hypothetical protein ACTI_49490 [Actinoplanes sp. OR16]